ncbi:MAG: NAD(P)/FAD-dependent oxidoreductase, partial [Candidatus Kariarchaeaceae archaeon]
MENSKTIIILGGGVGGLITANLLRKKIPKHHKILLIDKEANHIFSPSFLWLLTDDRKPEKIIKPLAKLQNKGIDVLQGEVTKINCESREVEVGENLYKGDYIIISLGADLAPEQIPGLESGGYNLFTLEGAVDFRNEWLNFTDGKLVIITSTPLYKCPAAPYEAAMLLQHNVLVNYTTKNVQVELYTAESGPMGVTGADNSLAVRQMVEQKGVLYHPESVIEKVDPQTKNLFFSNGVEVSYDLLLYVPPHQAPTVIKEAGLVDTTGWVAVNRNTLETSHDGVYAIGDITGIPLKVGPLLPKAGVFAHNQAKVVANNIAVKITGKGKNIEYNGDGGCFVEIGGGKAGFGRGNFYSEPAPQVKMYKPRRYWHWGKVWFEKRWLS